MPRDGSLGTRSLWRKEGNLISRALSVWGNFRHVLLEKVEDNYCTILLSEPPIKGEGRTLKVSFHPPRAIDDLREAHRRAPEQRFSVRIHRMRGRRINVGATCLRQTHEGAVRLFLIFGGTAWEIERISKGIYERKR